MIGIKCIEYSSGRWRNAHKENGVIGLDDTRGKNSGRPRQSELSKDELIAKQTTKI